MSREPGKTPDTSYYGGYYYGEGSAGYADNAFAPSRSVKDYLIILRERIWWLIAVAFIIFTGSLIYTFNATPIYTSVATVQVLRQQDKSVQFEDVVDLTIKNEQDFNTQVELIKSIHLIRNVADRMKGDMEARFLAPFLDDRFAWLRDTSLPAVLMESRSITPIRQTLVVAIQVKHPDPELAADVANLFAQEFVNLNMARRLEGSKDAMESLKQKAEAQRKLVEDLETALANFKETHKSLSFESAAIIDEKDLVDLNQIRTQDKRVLDEAETQWAMVQQLRRDGRDLWELPFIANSEQVTSLLQRRSVYRIEIASLSKKYREKHPRMQEAVNALKQVESELNLLVNSAAEGVYNNLVRARENYRLSEQRIADKRDEMLKLERLRIEYNTLARNRDVNQDHYLYLYNRMQQAQAQATDNAGSVQIIDRALPSIRPTSPKWILNLGLGLFGGIGAGFGIVFLLAFFDDKVKTAFDIENTVGLPLIGIVPRITRADATSKAKMIADGTDRHTVEAFRGIHSTLNLNEESKKAKVILTTSTIPGEGKSFVSTNMALTFASHGERTLIIDCDLRMPNVAKSLNLENKNGILQVLNGDLTLDQAIIKNFWTNTDVLVAGGRTKSPTQLLSSQKFEGILHELRMRYDKIIIDSPPLAPVSDALNILPLTDGVIYVIRFNTTKRKSAALNVRRLRESNVPVFGAILNNINTAVAGYYYSNYYDKSYAQYYIDPKFDDENDESSKKKSRKLAPSA